MTEKRIQIKDIVKSQIPQYVKEDFPLVQEFLTQYYLAQEFQGAPADLLQNIDQYVKLDNMTNLKSSTLLGSNISAVDTNISISLLDSETGTEGFPDKYGLISIDNELIVYEYKTSTGFNNCYRGFSGVVAYKNTNIGIGSTFKLKSSDQLVFKESNADSHLEGAEIFNLSDLFLKEFLIKTKYQISPGFENRSFTEKVNEATLLKQIKDFYRSKGTDRSFEILFKALYGDEVKIIRPRDFLFRPSDAQYKITNDLVVELISGPIEDIPNLTLFQNEYQDISKSYGTVSEIESIIADDGRSFYKLKIDGGYNGDPAFDGAIYGRFSVHPKTRSIGIFEEGSTAIDVDSTVGFPNQGELFVEFANQTTGIVSYRSKTLNQFLECSNISYQISNNSRIGINTYASAVTGFGTEIRVRINSILSDVSIDADNYFYSKDDTATIPTLGYQGKTSADNDWIFNTAATYDVESYEIIDSSDKTYSLTLKNRHSFQIGDKLDIIELGNVIASSIVLDVLSEKTISISQQGVLIGNGFKVRRKILKVDSLKFSDANILAANVQNVYRDGNKILVASPSLPNYVNQKLNANNRSLKFSGVFAANNDTFAITKLEDHGFYTGDAVYYTPEKVTSTSIDVDGNELTSTVISSSLFDEGIYFIKRVDANNVKFAKSKSDILNNKFLSLIGETTINDNILEPYDFVGKTLESQKLLREISPPVLSNSHKKTLPGFTGILVNGVEILNYKSKDKIFYGPIEEIEVLSEGSNYDIINPPQLSISDSTGVGATGYCSVFGSLSEIRVLDPGFDYINVPTVKITGGNGVGAQARANMKLITHEVSFNSEFKSAKVGVGSTVSTIGFSTSHKFRNGEEVIYRTFGQKSISGLSTNSKYYVSSISPTVVKLHRSFNDAISGINTIVLGDYGIGNHAFECTNKKSVLASIVIENSGFGYQNKKRSVSSSGINTTTDSFYIKNHDFSSGEIITYSTTGVSVGGLTNNSNYFVTKIDNDNFRISEVGSGNVSEDFYYRTKQFVDITSTNDSLHTFNYPQISVELIGNLGVSSEYKAQVQPVFRGSIRSVHLSSGGSSYGVEDIFNIDRQPNITILNGSGSEIQPVISNGKIVQVLVNNTGKNYTSLPNLVVSGLGNGAILTPVISNNKLTEVKVIDGGSGYSQNSTSISAVDPGLGAAFRAKIKSWTVNLYQKYINKITEDDGFLTLGTGKDFGLQYAHIYAPRKLRELLFSRDQSGKILYSNSDLRISNSAEINSKDHSPIIGWAYDGNPIYGPYGYSSKSGGVVSQMKSGYRLEVNPSRPSLNHFPEGFFIEDYVFYKSNDETVLDEKNGRFCVTPDYPNGTYAYFATIDDSSVESSGPFSGYKKPIFPYLIGDAYKAIPNEFNFNRFSNQDIINLNKTNWIRNTYPYNIIENESTYDYITIPNKLNQTIDVVGVSPGSIDSVGILTGGNNYKVNDRIVFNNIDSNQNIRGYSASAIVSKVSGKTISNISVSSSTLNNVEFYPIGNKGEYVLYTDSPHGFTNFDLVSITGLSTTSSLIEGNYIAGIETSKLSLSGIGTTTIGIGTVGATGIVTFISVKGSLGFLNIRENDIFGLNGEKIKVLNIDNVSSRLRILRQIDGTIGASHSVTSVLYEDPRKLKINSGFKTDYSYTINKEIYFNPVESVAIGTNSSIGIGSTVRFSNPGAGLTEVFIGNSLIYLPNHNLNTGDLLTYKTNGGTPISVWSVGVGTTSLFTNTNVYVARFDKDFIGISTVKVGLGTTGFFAGIGTTTSNIRPLFFTGFGTGVYHSFTTNYSVITGKVSKNVVTVSTAETHGLSNGDYVEIDVNPELTTSIIVKYDDHNRKLVINPKSFSSPNVNIDTNSIIINDHNFKSGDKVIHTSSLPSGGLLNEEIYYIIFVDKNTIRLSDSYYNSTKINPYAIDITSASSGFLSLVNPPLKLYKNSLIEFDLSDPSLSYNYQSTRYPAFRFEIYKDSNFLNVFDSSQVSRIFNVHRDGTVGISSDAKVRFIVNEYLPKVLYYNLVPVYDSVLPQEKKEISSDNSVISYNEIQIEQSIYNGLHEITTPSSTTFRYFLEKEPEAVSYASSTSILKYYTNSLTAFGPIKDIKILNKGVNYYSLPSISTVSSLNGSNAVLEVKSNSIGKIKKTRIIDVGFDYPSDYTLKPKISLPKIIKIDGLASIESIGITSFGRGYISPPKLLVFDGKTKKLVPEVDLKYTLGKQNVEIKNNTYGIYNTPPTILPVENSNGVGIKTISYNSSSKKVTVGLSTGFSIPGSFPFQVNDRVLIENISVGINSSGKGYNSENYDYQLFTLTEVDENIGGIGSVTYSLDGYLLESEFPGSFDPSNSAGRIIPEKFFPVFSTVLSTNDYKIGEIVKSGNSEGVVENWDSFTNYLKVSTKDSFFVDDRIEGLSSKTQGIASSVTEFDSYAVLDSTSRFKTGWKTDVGFLNGDQQRMQDSFYYQNFSYAIKSKIPFDTWNDAVSTLNHTVGFKKFSDLQIESKISEESNTSLTVGVSTENTSVETIVDMVGYGDINCVSDFDVAKENSLKINSRVFSNQISFENRILTDYFESFGNRVLSIDDFSSEFNSNPRPTNYSDVHRFDLRSIRAQKYLTFIKDRRYTGQRQAMLVTLLHDDAVGYLNQYGRVETTYDLGSFDFAIDGSEGILQYYPTRFTINDYDVATISYNIKDDMAGIGSTSISSAVTIDTSNVTTVGIATTTIVSFAKTSFTSSKIFIEIASDSEYEIDEISIVHDGTNIEMIEYGQLTSSPSLLSSSGFGTYYPYISGSNVKIDFIPNSSVGSATTINTIKVSLAGTSITGIGTLDIKHARLEARTLNIPSSASPGITTVLSYSGEYSAAYCLVQVSDLTNNRHQFSEVVLINDDTVEDAYITEFANIETYAGLGTIGGSVTGLGQTTQLIFKPLPNIQTQVKVYANILRIQDDTKDVVDLNNGTIETNNGVYYGTERDLRRSFDLKHKTYPIFERYFAGFSSSVINVDENTIELPSHFFVTGEKVTYNYAGAGTTQAIGIATTTITGLGSTDKLPTELYIVKITENKVKVAASATDALKSIPNILDLSSVGIGTSHRFTAHNQNAKVIVALDNIIQSPVVATSQTTTLSKNVFTTDDILFFSGITSFFGGDLIRLGNEIMKIDSVGVGSTNAIRVRRPWLGTVVAGYATGDLVTKVTGTYNIIGSNINFVEAPYGNVPLSSTTNRPDERDWTGIATGSHFQGRSFMRSGITNSSNESYYKNYIFDNVSNSFNGLNRTFTLKNSGSNVSGISNEHAVILINDVFQGPGISADYTLIESSGITSVRFAGTASSVSYDVNSSNLPIGGIILSVGSTEGFGYQPLVAAGGTAIVSGLGTISSVSIANSGSGYRVGVQTVRVGVQTSDNNGFYLKFIGTAVVSNGNIVSIGITNPGVGYTSSNPPKVVIDTPLSYSDIPLVYSSSSSGFGTAATVDIVVGQGSSVISFEIKNTGYGYKEGEVLTVPIGGRTGIPTESSFKEFQLTIQNIFADKFTGWSIGELQLMDDISDLFDGETRAFPLKVSGNLVSIKASKGSNINVQDLLLVFVNDVLQVPGEGYIFNGGSIITFTEAPKGNSLGIPGTNDKCKIIFYKGSGSVDVVEKDVLETVKVGDKLTFGYDSSTGQPSSLQEEERTVTSIVATDLVNTNPYFGPGNTEDESIARTITWCRQTEDKIIDEKEISKDRMLYEPAINPVAYLTKTVGIGSTIVYVDNLRPFFNQINESSTSLTFQKEITFISQDTKTSAAATAIVSTAGTITSVVVSDGGFGYSVAPTVIFENPVGLGTTYRASGIATISSAGIVTSISIVGMGTGYSQENPPIVFIEPPKSVSETNTVSQYKGDFGFIVGISTTSVGVAVTGIVFNLAIEKNSFLRNASITGVTTISGITTGDYFAVFNTNVGHGVTSLNESGQIIGIGSTCLDNIYRVAAVSIAQTGAPGLGITYVARVTVSVSGYNSLTGLGYSSFFGNYSWGRIDLDSRSAENSFNAYTRSAYIGISTGTLVRRSKSLKYFNYIP
jgi:hypothetical protein